MTTLDMEARPPVSPTNFAAALRASVAAATDWLLARQKPDGHWVGRAESNGCMEAQWRLCLWFLGLDDHPLCARLAQSLIGAQREDGAWEIYFRAPNGDINTTVEAYAALRCSGYAENHPALLKAQRWIESKGGLRNVRVFTRYWLALIGEWPWEKTPNLPPEVIWLPLWFPFNIYHFAQWARATLMPIAIFRRAALPARCRRSDGSTLCSRKAAPPSITTCRKRTTPAAGTFSSATPTRSCTPSSNSAIAFV